MSAKPRPLPTPDNFTAAVRLTSDFVDLPTGMAYPAGTILYRLSGGQYGVKGTRLGQQCVAGYYLIKDISEPYSES